MASIRSKIAAGITRLTLKRKLGASGSVDEERATLEKMSKLTARRKPGAAALVGGVKGEWAEPAVHTANRTILYLHGGGYVIGSPASHRDMVSAIADAAQARALILDYRLGPEHPFPAAVDDALAAYRGLLQEGCAAQSLFIAGDSAGGGLTIATLLSIKQAGLPLPAAGICLSPWVDLTLESGTMISKAADDPLVTPDALRWMRDQYLAGQDPKATLASPLFADLSGLPPLLLQVGSEEVLLDDSRNLNDRAKAAGVEVTLEVWNGMMHVWHLMAMMIPEGKQAIQAIGNYIAARSPTGVSAPS